jgi:predicted nucleic acid-binding protein
MAYFEDEPSGKEVEDIIADARENRTPMMMSVVNAGEVWHIIAREVSEAVADSKIAELRRLGVEFINADWMLASEAARFKSKHRISFADCFAAALARINKADLVTGDKEFKQIEHRLKILWV